MQLILPRDRAFIRSGGGVPKVNWANPITDGLTALVLPGVSGPTPIFTWNLVTGQGLVLFNTNGFGVHNGSYLDSFPIVPCFSKLGVGARPAFTSYTWDLGPVANLFHESVTFGVSRRCGLSDPPSGWQYTSSQLVYFPYSGDGNIYFDFPTISSRIGPLTYTNRSLNVENFTFVAQPGYRAVFKDGAPLGTQASGAAGDGATAGTNLWFGFGSTTNLEWYLFAVWNRALSTAESTSFTLDPLQLISWPEDELFAELVGVAGAGTSVTLDMPAVFEFLASQRREAPVLLESLTAVQRDPSAPIEILSIQTTDRPVALEALSTQTTDRSMPVESLAGTQADNRLSAEFLASVQTDIGTPAESAAIIRADVSVPAEFLLLVRGDAQLVLEALATQRGDPDLPAETAGGILVTANGVAAVEFLGVVRSDPSLPAEITARLVSDMLSGAESSGSVRAGLRASGEALLAVGADAKAAAELLGSIKADPGAAAEALTTAHGIAGDSAVALEWQAVPAPGPGQIVTAQPGPAVQSNPTVVVVAGVTITPQANPDLTPKN